MNFNFDEFESVDNTHERKSGYTLVKEQEYENLKYRKAVKKIPQADGTKKEEIEGRFYIAKKKFADLGLNTNGLRQFTAPSGVTILAVVADQDALILKSSKKSKSGNKLENFKSPKLEAALEALKVIDTTKVGENQFIDLVSIGKGVSIKGVSVIEAFTLVAGQPKLKTEKEAVAETVAPVSAASVATAPVVNTPKVEAEAPAATAQSDWD